MHGRRETFNSLTPATAIARGDTLIARLVRNTIRPPGERIRGAAQVGSEISTRRTPVGPRNAPALRTRSSNRSARWAADDQDAMTLYSYNSSGPQAWFDALPLWLLFLLTLVLVAIAIEVGFRLGRRARQQPRHEAEPQVTLVVTSVLGLVAFIVGFTLGLAESRYESRRESKFAEADAISTAYGRASLLPDTSRDRVRDLLRRAAAAGLELGSSTGTDGAVAALVIIRDSLWQVASSEANAHPESQTIALFLESIGLVFDVFEREVFVARHGRIPTTIWIVMLALIVLGAALTGYHSGLSGARPTWAMAALALALSTVIYVIADLDRPHKGTLRLSREAMTELHRTFRPRPR